MDGAVYVLGHSMQDVTDEGEEQSRGQHSTLWDALLEGPLFAQVLFYLDFGFPVMIVLSNPFVHLPSNTKLAQFRFFRPSFHTLSNAFSRPIHTASVRFLSWKASSVA